MLDQNYQRLKEEKKSLKNFVHYSMYSYWKYIEKFAQGRFKEIEDKIRLKCDILSTENSLITKKMHEIMKTNSDCEVKIKFLNDEVEEKQREVENSLDLHQEKDNKISELEKYYKELEAEREIMVSLFKKSSEDSKEIIELKENKILELKKSNETAKEMIILKEYKIAEMENCNTALIEINVLKDTQILELENSRVGFKEIIAAREAQIIELKERIITAETLVSDLERINRDILMEKTAQTSDLTKYISQLNEMISEKDKEITEIIRKCHEDISKISIAKDNLIHELEKSNRDFEDEINKNLTRSLQLERDCEYLVNISNEKDKQILELEKSKKDLELINAEKQNKITDLHLNNTKVEKSLSEKDHEISELRVRIDRCKLEKAEKVDKITKLENDSVNLIELVSSNRLKISKLEKLINNLDEIDVKNKLKVTELEECISKLNENIKIKQNIIFNLESREIDSIQYKSESELLKIRYAKLIDERDSKIIELERCLIGLKSEFEMQIALYYKNRNLNFIYILNAIKELKDDLNELKAVPLCILETKEMLGRIIGSAMLNATEKDKRIENLNDLISNLSNELKFKTAVNLKLKNQFQTTKNEILSVKSDLGHIRLLLAKELKVFPTNVDKIFIDLRNKIHSVTTKFKPALPEVAINNNIKKLLQNKSEVLAYFKICRFGLTNLREEYLSFQDEFLENRPKIEKIVNKMVQDNQKLLQESLLKIKFLENQIAQKNDQIQSLKMQLNMSKLKISFSLGNLSSNLKQIKSDYSGLRKFVDGVLANNKNINRSDCESIHENFGQLNNENSALKDANQFLQLQLSDFFGFKNRLENEKKALIINSNEKFKRFKVDFICIRTEVQDLAKKYDSEFEILRNDLIYHVQGCIKQGNKMKDRSIQRYDIIKQNSSTLKIHLNTLKRDFCKDRLEFLKLINLLENCLKDCKNRETLEALKNHIHSLTEKFSQEKAQDNSNYFFAINELKSQLDSKEQELERLKALSLSKSEMIEKFCESNLNTKSVLWKLRGDIAEIRLFILSNNKDFNKMKLVRNSFLAKSNTRIKEKDKINLLTIKKFKIACEIIGKFKCNLKENKLIIEDLKHQMMYLAKFVFLFNKESLNAILNFKKNSKTNLKLKEINDYAQKTKLDLEGLKNDFLRIVKFMEGFNKDVVFKIGVKNKKINEEMLSLKDNIKTLDLEKTKLFVDMNFAKKLCDNYKTFIISNSSKICHIKSENLELKLQVKNLNSDFFHSFNSFKKQLYRKINEKKLLELEKLESVVEIQTNYSENDKTAISTIILNTKFSEILNRLKIELDFITSEFELKNMTTQELNAKIRLSVEKCFHQTSEMMNSYAIDVEKNREQVLNKLNHAKEYYEIKLKEVLSGNKRSPIMSLHNEASVIQKWYRKRRFRTIFSTYKRLVFTNPIELLKQIGPGLANEYLYNPNLSKCFRFGGDTFPPQVLFNPEMLNDESTDVSTY